MDMVDGTTHDIRIVVLMNGLQLLGEVEESEEEILISHPLTVVNAPPDPAHPERGPRVGLAPFMPYTKDFEHGLDLNRKHILAITVPLDDLVNEHRRQFSRIITSPSIIPPR